MEQKFVYLFSQEDNKFIGFEPAYQSAVNPKEYVVPNNGTLIKPLDPRAGYDVVWNRKDNKWLYVANGQKTQEQSEVEAKILELKQKLKEEGDYKILKNFEAKEAGLPLIYDPIKLHNENESIRIRIRELEKELRK